MSGRKLYHFSQSIYAFFVGLISFLNYSEAAIIKYTLEVAYFSGSPDGIYTDKILGINGQFPGPTLEASVGDILEVLLVNNIQDGQNTTIHWHGIHQKGSLFEDGTSQISQCPLPTGKSQTYRFAVTQPGTYWYHSHVNSQYTEGMFGGLLVHGEPESYDYDGELTLILSDWYHQTAIENEEWHLSPQSRGVPPYPNSGLINGMGRYPCDYAWIQGRKCNADLQMRPVFRVEQSKTYRVRLINAAAVAAFNFSIDGHTLKTIEADGVDVANPVEADIIPIAAGQRYSFLIECNRTLSINTNSSRFLIRADLRKESLMLIEGVNINKHPEALLVDLTAVIECTHENLDDHVKHIEINSERFTYDNVVPPRKNSKYLNFLDEMLLSPYDGISAPDHIDQEFLVHAGFYEDHEDIRRGSFNSTPFVLPQNKPLLMTLLDGEPLPENSFPLEIEFGNVIQLVINNPFFGPHPFHLHGHHFWILGMGKWYDGDYDSSRHKLTLDGVKRDTVLVHEQSWAVIRFNADNPGLWTFHCHIDWHNLSGMALTFIEAADLVRREMIISEEAMRICAMHRNGIK